MKSILSPYDDVEFNKYLLDYTKKSLERKCFVFTKDDSERKYYIDQNIYQYKTHKDIINSFSLINGRLLKFTDQKLINHAVYNLGQRFWYDELKHINNSIHKLYMQYKQSVFRDSHITLLRGNK